MDGEIFHLDKSLLNPKFDGYKLHILPQDKAVLQFPLIGQPTQATPSGKVPLAFQEVQSRITHNHLAIHSESGRGVYVDAYYNVILVELGQDRLSPSMRQIFELPKSIQSDMVDTGVHREYPSASFISSTTLLVSDGQGTMYILVVPEPSQEADASVWGPYVFPSSSAGSTESVGSPFRIHHVHQSSPLHAIVILSSRCYSSHPLDPTLGVEYDVWAIRIQLPDSQGNGTTTPVEVLWHRHGKGVPMHVSFIESLGLHLLIGDSGYRKLNTPPLSTYEPTPDEITSIPSANEPSVSAQLSQRPPPYSWTQTFDSVTVAIPLPSTTPKEAIKVHFTPTTLTFHVDLNPTIATPLEGIPHKYSAKQLWDGIFPSASFWTFDRQAERSYGILSLHMEKQNEDTRWSHVFASAGTDSMAEDDLEVPETLDPSELWNIRESLERYTAALQGEDMSGLGLGKGIPSLAENEMDEEVDSSIGRRAFITWVHDPTQEGPQPEFLSRQQHPFPFKLLSTPIPGRMNDSTTLIVKSNIDGTVFALDDSSFIGTQPPAWKHTSTYPALAFVLASKRDTRFTHHIPGKGVLAFEGGSNNRGGNVYIYYPTGPNALTAKQSILKINDGSGGALMGVGSFTDSSGDTVIACLTEGELTLIRGV